MLHSKAGLMQGQPSPIPSPGWPRLPPLQGCYCCIAFAKTQPDQQSEGSSINRKAVFSHQAEISGATGLCSLHSSVSTCKPHNRRRKWRQGRIHTFSCPKQWNCENASLFKPGPTLQRTAFTWYPVNGAPQVRPAIVWSVTPETV